MQSREPVAGEKTKKPAKGPCKTMASPRLFETAEKERLTIQLSRKEVISRICLKEVSIHLGPHFKT